MGWPGRALATTLYSVPGLTPVPLTCVGMPLPGPRTFHLPSLPGDLSSQLVTAGLTRAQREALGKLALFEGYVRELSGVHLLTCGMPYMMQRLFLLNVYVPRTAHHVPWTVYHAPRTSHRAQGAGQHVRRWMWGAVVSNADCVDCVFLRLGVRADRERVLKGGSPVNGCVALCPWLSVAPPGTMPWWTMGVSGTVLPWTRVPSPSSATQSCTALAPWTSRLTSCTTWCSGEMTGAYVSSI